jgi:chlorobactene glucosyltransferase
VNGRLVLSLADYQTILIVILVLAGLNLAANLHMLRQATPRQDRSVPGERVSVLIPARNEERNIRRCVQSLLAQEYTPFEVWVLDDGSTDATAAIVAEMAERDGRLHLIEGSPLPQGWMGKNYACHQLAELAEGDWLLFVDADTYHHPGALAWAVGAARQNEADLLSLIPRTVTHTLGEDILLPIIPFGLLGCFPLALGVRFQIASLAMAVGPFMLFRRAAYEDVEGHRAVRGEIAEDVALARAVCRAGRRVTIVDGSERVDVHFYCGFWESWHGLAKSAFAALGYRLLPTLLMLGLYGFLFVWPAVLVVMGCLTDAIPAPALRLACAIAALNAGLWYAVATRFRLSRTIAFLYPLTVALVILIMLDSIRRSAFAGIPWKDRLYRVRGGILRH